jgi:hypothetical protein
MQPQTHPFCIYAAMNRPDRILDEETSSRTNSAPRAWKWESLNTLTLCGDASTEYHARAREPRIERPGNLEGGK